MAEISPLRRRMIEDMTVRNLSPATQQSYLNAVSKFSRYFGRSPDRLGLEDVHAFQVHLVATGISWPALNQIVCALRFFYGVTLGQNTVPCSSTQDMYCTGGKPPKSRILGVQQPARLAFEQLGPTFVKLGQMLSTNLLPPAWTTELARLHSDVAPVPFDDLLPQIEQALGRSPFEVFAHVEREPYAAASIAQIHRAKLASGTPVVLKIRRPRIEAKIDADLKLLDRLARRTDAALPQSSSLWKSRPQVGAVMIPMMISLLTYCGLVGYLVAFVNSLWIIFSIWRDQACTFDFKSGHTKTEFCDLRDGRQRSVCNAEI